MWKTESVAEATSEAWLAYLDANPPALQAQRAAKYVLQLMLRAPELYIGNDTPYLLQLLGGPGDKGELDVVCTLLAPDGDIEGTRLCCTLRGPTVFLFVASFMEEFPTAPVLVEREAQNYDYVLCEVDDEPWSRGPITLQRLRMLRNLNGRDTLQFFLPAEANKNSEPAHRRFPERPPVYQS